jgi:flagellin-like protein
MELMGSAPVRRPAILGGLCQRDLMPLVIRRALTGLVATLLGVAMVVVAAVPAQARYAYTSKVGAVFGEYLVSNVDYNGYFNAARSDGSQCVSIQRKAGGVWRDNVSTQAGVNQWCDGDPLDWWITDYTLATNTTAIRIVVTWGAYLGSYVVLCSSTADCRQM